PGQVCALCGSVAKFSYPLLTLNYNNQQSIPPTIPNTSSTAKIISITFTQTGTLPFSTFASVFITVLAFYLRSNRSTHD
ncbi:MAG TPA: hypothetical protein VKP08_11710, partial [Anaerolineales bacterium]|nr:hypothetical protein [Anaerolineales bacterium]